MTLDEFFDGRDEARAIFDALRAEIEALGQTQMRVTKSQVAFATTHNVAVVWTPDRYLGPERSAPLVVTVSLHRHDTSPRWKEIVTAGVGRFTHHLELQSPTDVDDEVRAWLVEAWNVAEGAR